MGMRDTVTRNSRRTSAPGRGRARAGRVAGSSRQGHVLLNLLAILLLAAGALVWALGPGPDAGAAPAEPFAEPDAAASLPAETPGAVASQRESVAAQPARAAAPEASSPAPRADRAPPLDERKGPRTEAEHVAALRALARSDPAEFGRRVESLLAGTGAAVEQFAALRAAYEEDWPGTIDLCVRAVAALPRASGPAAESVPETLVQWLSQRAPRDPRAREALAAVVWTAPAGAESAFRSRALRALVRACPEADVPLLARRIHAEGDPDVHSAGRAALEERAQPAPTPDSREELP